MSNLKRPTSKLPLEEVERLANIFDVLIKMDMQENIK